MIQGIGIINFSCRPCTDPGTMSIQLLPDREDCDTCPACKVSHCLVPDHRDHLLLLGEALPPQPGLEGQCCVRNSGVLLQSVWEAGLCGGGLDRAHEMQY